MTDYTPPFPVANSTLSFWRTEPDELDSHRTTPDVPKECDICIVGAGMAGVSTAYHLMKSQAGGSVVMLEAREVCSGATGRNGGHIKMGYPAIANTQEKYGKEAAAELCAFVDATLHTIKRVVEEEAIDCDFVMTRSFDVFCNQEVADDVKAKFQKTAKDGDELVKDAGLIPDKFTQRLTSIPSAKAAFTVPAASLWPYKFVLGLLRICSQLGLNIQANTPVTSVSSNPNATSEYRHLVETPRGTLQAKKIVFATNAYTPGILHEFKDHIVPVRGTCSRIITPKGLEGPLLSNTYGIRWAEKGSYDYLVPRPDGSIIVGGANRNDEERKRRCYGVWDDSALPDGIEKYFEGLMRRGFRGWEGSGEKVDKVWSGIMGYTPDGVPHIGEVPGKPGQYILAGFNGGGMPLIFLSAKGVAKMMQGANFEDSGIPKIFRATQERLNSESRLL